MKRMLIRKAVVRAAALMAAAAVAGIGPGIGVVRAQQQSQRPQQPQPIGTQGDLEILQLRPNFYMIVGAGGNIAVQVGPDGAVVVDSGTEDKADAVVAAIKKLSPEPIRFVIDTSARPEHVGGNEKVARAGETLFNIISNPQNMAMTNGGAAGIVAAETVLRRMSAPGSGGESALPRAAWPTDAFLERRKYMYFNGEGIELLHQSAAVTDGDSIVFFRRSDVVAAGDILDMTRFPMIDVAGGGSIQGEIDALNKLVELAIPSIPMDWRDDGTLVVPGHGRVCDQYDVVEYRDMVTIIRDRIRDLIRQGKTLEQVKAASPTVGYSRQYGSDSGPWTTNMFIEAVYKSLIQAQEKKQ
jgi:cyclase